MAEEGVYRTAGYSCPACRTSLREFQHRFVCDECMGMMIGFTDFESACADLSHGYDAHLELSDKELSNVTCPVCNQTMQTCKLRVGDVKIRKTIALCEKDGFWFGKGLLSDVFARISSKYHYGGGPYFTGTHTRPMFAAGRTGSASDGLGITAWRNRPRKRAHTLTPVNAYRDQKLGCPVCPDMKLYFMGDRFACDQCHGLFVENGAVEALVTDMLGQVWQIPAPVGQPGARPCPVCETPLIVETFEGATVDRCPAHGVWFDPKELEQVLKHADDHHRPHGWLRRLFG